MYVTPKTDCPHVLDETKLFDFTDFQKIDLKNFNCESCTELKENWLCLICGKFFCSRYINSHFVKHNEENKSHNLCISMADLSLWCYDCESYIVSKNLKKYEKKVASAKFQENGESSVFELEDAFNCLNIKKDDVKDLKYESFIYELKNLKFTKISFLTGAGISTSAGIPDFRSPKSGLFVTLKEKYKLKSLEEFFSIELFRKTPELYYDFSREFNLEKYDPTPSHWFIRFIENKNLLNMVYTQNIDCLENKTNLSREKIVFAHGNILAGHCSNAKCNKDIDLELLNKNIKENKVLLCDKCNSPCKHRIVFYGERLPEEFHTNMEVKYNFKKKKFSESDLCFIMGTSLAVAPINNIPRYLDKERTLVMLNMDKVGNFKFDASDNKDIFVQGLIDDSVNRIIEDCGWKDEFEKFVETEKKIFEEKINK